MNAPIATKVRDCTFDGRAIAFVLGCSLVGCGPSPARATTVSSPHQAAVSLARATPQEPAEDPTTARFRRLFCGKTQSCIAEVWPAGRDRTGRNLSVVAVDVDEDGGPNSDSEESPAAESLARSRVCHRYWLVSEASPQQRERAISSQLRLAEDCAGEKWETFADVDPERKTFSHGGNSLFSVHQYGSTETLGLDPPRLVETSESSLHLLSSEQTWNFDEFTGTVTLGIDYCPGKVPPGVQVPTDRDYAFLETSAVLVPRVALAEDFRDGGWRSSELGRCAAHIDGEQRGFSLSRRSEGAADSWMKLVLSQQNELFVEIQDDRFSPDPRGFKNGDHLELWLSTPEQSCADPQAPPPLLEWGIRVPDGRAFAAFGRPSGALSVEQVTTSSGKIRLKIALTNRLRPADRFTVVYVDRDEGKAAQRSIATSTFSSPEWWTLGQVRDIDASTATCIVEQGALQPSVRGWPAETDQ